MRERISAGSFKDKEGGSREGPSKFGTKNPNKTNKTNVAGGQSMWSGRGKETGRTASKGEMKSDHQ